MRLLVPECVQGRPFAEFWDLVLFPNHEAVHETVGSTRWAWRAPVRSGESAWTPYPVGSSARPSPLWRFTIRFTVGSLRLIASTSSLYCCRSTWWAATHHPGP